MVGGDGVEWLVVVGELVVSLSGSGGGGGPVGQSDSSLQQQQDQQVYRDRAKERRLKYGEDDEMQKRAAKNKVSPLQVFVLFFPTRRLRKFSTTFFTFSLKLRIFHLNSKVFLYHQNVRILS